MEGWRLYAAMIGLAAVTGMVVALVLSGGPRLPESRPAASAAVVPVSSAAPSSLPSTRPTASPRPTAPPSPSPSPASRSDLAGLLRPLTASWRPAVTSLLFTRSSGVGGTTIMALPITANAPPPAQSPSGSSSPKPPVPPVAAPVPLVSFGASGGWQARADGSVLAISLETVAGSARLATWNLRTGVTRWVTDDEPGVRQVTPVWSVDGSLLYYAAARGTTDLGIFRVRADGTAKTLLRAPDAKFAGVTLTGLTADGGGLAWSYVRAGGSVDVFDLRSGRDRAFDDAAAAAALSWRPTRPRALVKVGGCCAGSSGGTLTLWDDLAPSSRVLIPAQAGSPSGVLAADWDPTGARIVASVTERSGGGETSSLLTLDPSGAARTPIAQTEGATAVLWLRAGIIYARTTGAGTELVLVSPSGGPGIVLYSDDGPIEQLTFATP